MQPYGDNCNEYTYKHVLTGHFIDDLQTDPFKCTNGYHDHYAYQRSHWNTLNNRCAEKNDQQDGVCGNNARQPCPGTGRKVNKRLGDHRATTHSRKKAIEYISCSLCHRFLVAAAFSSGDLIHHVKCKQRFNKTNSSPSQANKGKWSLACPG